jgi:hypothetical protein
LTESGKNDKLLKKLSRIRFESPRATHLPACSIDHGNGPDYDAFRRCKISDGLGCRPSPGGAVLAGAWPFHNKNIKDKRTMG